MAIISISSNLLRAEINPVGAELKSVISVKDNFEYMWNADPKYWNRSSPILFPIVGELKNKTYNYAGKNFHLPRHGFIRNYVFNVLNRETNSVEFEFCANDETMENFPFNFSLRVKYKIELDRIFINYRVFNLDSKVLLYSLGAHPGFMLHDEMKNYFIEFSHEEDTERFAVINGLISDKAVKFKTNDKKLYLSKDLFIQDAIVFKKLFSKSAKLLHAKTGRGIKLNWCDKFSFFGIWSQKNCDSFVCLEPWAGIADNEKSSGILEDKEGIRKINIHEKEEFNLEFYFF